jgi:hypothetical protein
LKRPDQKPLWGALTAQLEEKAGNGHQIYYDCALVDITERKQREQEREAIISMSAALRLARLRSEMPQIIIDNVAFATEDQWGCPGVERSGSGDLHSKSPRENGIIYPGRAWSNGATSPWRSWPTAKSTRTTG